MGFFLFGAIAHESSHALMVRIFGLPFKYSLAQVIYDSTNASEIAKTLIGFAGGIGQAVTSLISFWLVTCLEKRKVNLFLLAIGFEIAFLSIAFMGIINSVWEGFFYSSYVDYYSSSTIFSVEIILSMVTSAYIIKKWRGKRINALFLSDKH